MTKKEVKAIIYACVAGFGTLTGFVVLGKILGI